MFLDLRKNKLKNLPNEIGECTALSDLYLSDNEISELPKTIGISKLWYFLILIN
jgi:Leucine-rich repeat (LRR) protein